MRVFNNKIREHSATYMNRVPLLHLGSPSHEFIIIAFYDEGVDWWPWQCLAENKDVAELGPVTYLHYSLVPWVSLRSVIFALPRYTDLI